MRGTIVLVGHCGPDATYLRAAVSRAAPGARVVSADDQEELDQLLRDGVDLLLVNRQLDWGFTSNEGIELITRVREKHPHVKTMLVSNFPDAQHAAMEAGALPGFGKREIGSLRATEAIRVALDQ